jgi:hypothetical protein
MLKHIVDFATLLIGAEGARSSKMLSHFLRAVLIQGSLFKVLREKQVLGDHTGALRLERKSTGKINRAIR